MITDSDAEKFAEKAIEIAGKYISKFDRPILKRAVSKAHTADGRHLNFERLLSMTGKDIAIEMRNINNYCSHQTWVFDEMGHSLPNPSCGWDGDEAPVNHTERVAAVVGKAKKPADNYGYEDDDEDDDEYSLDKLAKKAKRKHDRIMGEEEEMEREFALKFHY